MSFVNVYNTRVPGLRLTHGTVESGQVVPVDTADATSPLDADDIRLFKRNPNVQQVVVNVRLRGEVGDTCRVEVYILDPVQQAYVLTGTSETLTIAAGGEVGETAISRNFACNVLGLDWFVFLAAISVTAGPGNGVVVSAAGGGA